MQSLRSPTVPPSLVFYQTPPRTSPAPPRNPAAHDTALACSSRASPPHTAAARLPPQGPARPQASASELPPRRPGGFTQPRRHRRHPPPQLTPLPAARARVLPPRPLLLSTLGPLLLTRSSQNGGGSFLLGNLRPPPTRALASAASRPRPAPAPFRGLLGPPARARPLPGPPSPTSAAARSHGAAEAAARAEPQRTVFEKREPGRPSVHRRKGTLLSSQLSWEMRNQKTEDVLKQHPVITNQD
ncbi:proline-rich protein 36-like [Camelus ferus]|uniref:Proline-rich protein 36-like n=1 Tax=Camelus ferus TaxID=419612 RepID=A0A8B8SDA3_CAMFR|nr:proline-rich protein 36-like [Camelus ferus]